jgi:hypothetical protein
VVVDQDGVFGEGLAGVGVDGQGLVFDLDAFEGFDGVALGVGDDGGDVVADVADFFDGHGGDVADVVAVEGFAVAAGDDLDDAGHFFGFGGVDGEDFGVGEVGVEDGGVEEAGEADVVEVLGFADDLGDGVGAGEGLADVFEFRHGGAPCGSGSGMEQKDNTGRGAGNRKGLVCAGARKRFSGRAAGNGLPQMNANIRECAEGELRGCFTTEDTEGHGGRSKTKIFRQDEQDSQVLEGEGPPFCGARWRGCEVSSRARTEGAFREETTQPYASVGRVSSLSHRKTRCISVDSVVNKAVRLTGPSDWRVFALIRG